ncbi:MAG: YcxB family protein [Terriglobales bacterium]
MHLQYQLTKDDYLKAQDLHQKTAGIVGRASLYILPFFGVLLIAASAVNLLNSPRNWFVFLFGCLWGLFLMFHRKILLIRSFGKETKLQQSVEADISEGEFHAVGPTGETRTKWAGFDRYAESEDLFLLYTGPRIFFALPKRAFGPGEVEEFRELLRGKLPAK